MSSYSTPHGSTNHSISKVPDTKDTIKFKLDAQEITYTVDMFHDTLHLLVETLNNTFVALVKYRLLNLSCRGLAIRKDVIQYSRFTKLIISDLMKKFPSILQRINEDYHSIKDDIPLVSLYTTGNVQVRGMLILDAFLTGEMRATDNYTEYEMVFVKVVVLMNQPQPVVSTLGTHRSTPRAYKTPTPTVASPQGKKRKQRARETSLPRKSLKVTIKKKKQSTTLRLPPGEDRERDEIVEATLLSLTLYKTALAAKAQENIAKVQEKQDEEEIEKIVKGEEDEESYASEFVDSMLNDDDDSSNRIEPESHKEHPENVNDDDDEIEKEKNNDDHIDHTLVGSHATSISPTTATTSKNSSRSKSKRGFTSNKTKILPGSIAGMCRRRGQIRTHIKTKFATHEFFMGNIREVLDHCNSVVPEIVTPPNWVAAE
ncbi:hypothetical protein Tco_1030780 [Tanacetum coccineum]|uniref:Uncharacterized protein n=1 Tax=Tanacetum coccineum TaxID=301880 RepID=A0ABQ5G8V9_9ASTR